MTGGMVMWRAGCGESRTSGSEGGPGRRTSRKAQTAPCARPYWDGREGAPEWSKEFDLWAAEALERGDLDTLFDFRGRAPGMPFAHPTVEHFAPIFVALGAATDPAQAPKFTIEGYWLGLAKRSFEVR